MRTTTGGYNRIHSTVSLGPVPRGTALRCPFTYFLWNRTTGSASRSVTSRFLPFSMTSRCFRTNSHPMWEKKKPRRALWGSASVSEYLWWTRWSLDHSKMSFCRENADPKQRDNAPGTSLKASQPPPAPLLTILTTDFHFAPILSLKFNPRGFSGVVSIKTRVNPHWGILACVWGVPTAGDSELLGELVGKPERKFWIRLLTSPERSFVKKREIQSQGEVLVVRGWVWKGVGSWLGSLCPHTQPLMALMSNLKESRKPAS